MIEGAPLPRAEVDTATFWEGCEQKKFLLPRCVDCGAHRWPPGPMCPSCQSSETQWVEAEGHGRLYTWVVAHHPPNATMSESVPYAVGLIELDEGVRVVGNVNGCLTDELEAGLRVELVFDDVKPGFRLPNFRRAGS